MTSRFLLANCNRSLLTAVWHGDSMVASHEDQSLLVNLCKTLIVSASGTHLVNSADCLFERRKGFEVQAGISLILS